MCFDDVVVGHIEWIARIAFRFYKNKADADDLAQETLLRIYANSAKFTRFQTVGVNYYDQYRQDSARKEGACVFCWH